MMSSIKRRGFLGRAAGVLAALTVATPGVSSAAPSMSDHEGDAWMKPLKGRHRQLFHAIDLNERAMLMAGNFLDTYTDSFGAKPGEVNVVIGVHGPALAIGFNDAAWAKYGFANSSKLQDPTTKEVAQRNIFASGSPLSVDSLQSRGATFLMCNTALRLSSKALAAARGETPEAVYADLNASRLPNTILVPALVVAISRAQEASFSYVRV